MTDRLREYGGARALVLGASGFIGRWVARTLSELGAVVTSAVRNPGAFDPVAAAWEIDGDVVGFDALDRDDIRQVIRTTRPDIVFNVVGYGVDRGETDAGAMERINRDLVRHMVEGLAGTKATGGWAGRRLVHVGSALEYGLVQGVVREDTTPRPHTDYGRTKLAGTITLAEKAMSENLESVVARAFTVFGPGEHPGRLLPAIREAAATGSTVRLSAGTQRRDFGYVEDVAEGLLRLGLSSGAPGQVVNLATGRLSSVREFAETAAHVLGLSPDRLEFGTEPVRADEMQISGVEVARLRDLTGFSLPSDLDALLRRATSFETRLARISR